MTLSIGGIVCCLLLIYAAATVGFSRLLGRYGVSITSLPAVNEAVRLAPSDPDAHRAKASVFRPLKMYQEALKELEMAVSLRPSDDYLWLELGTVREELGDITGALRAFDRAVQQAPFYAHTRWQRANVRLRMGSYDLAFPELREAAKSNTNYLPALLDLSWAMSKEDASLTEQLAGISSPAERITFARFLAKHGKGKETVEQFQLVKNEISENHKRELIRQLVSFKAFASAFEIWSGTKSDAGPSIYDGGFEGTISFGDAGFGWIVPEDQEHVQNSLDTSVKDSGEKSLRIQFDGKSNPGAPIVSQRVLVKPQQRYRIYFATKAKDIVTGGEPYFSVVDTSQGVAFARSQNLGKSSDDWVRHELEFTTPANCDAIEVSLIRNNCQTSPCPIFGVLWLDSFAIVGVDH